MKLSLEQKKLVADKLNQKWKSKRCYFCSADNLTVTGHVQEIREYYKGNLVENCPVHPIIEVVCCSCGVVQLFSLTILGLIDTKTGDFIN